MPRGYYLRKPLFGPRFEQADLSDPIEYRGGRRRPFWDVMVARAADGDPKALSVLTARAEPLPFLEVNK